ncbi:hypothetical protein SEA_LILYPAD_64 [Gordonia phage LilyPad]|nr:hypothetical protein SEA_LILYPAD_64 [Gordonia phage LilyPad]
MRHKIQPRHSMSDPLITECGKEPQVHKEWISGVDTWVATWSDVNCERCLAKRDFGTSELAHDLEDDWGFLVKPATKQGERVGVLMAEWWDEFVKKNADYQTSTGNVSENFGLMGQYMKLTDKIHKLRKSMWDAEVIKEAMGQGLSNPKTDVTTPFQFEGTEEILRDIIGHCFLALDILEQKRNKG